MFEDQRPLGTPFTAASTADDVLQEVDLAGHQIIVTGGHGRLGREATRALAAAGAAVTVAARDTARAARTVESIPGVQVQQLDLTDPASIDTFAGRWIAAGKPLDALVNNAATMFAPRRRLDSRGNELSFSTSHLGHFQLTTALLPALLAAGRARVLNVTSGAARFGQIRWDDLAFDRGYDAGAAYSQAKLANVLFAVELDRRYAPSGVRAFAAHPGVIIGPGPHDPATRASYQEQGLIDDHSVTVIDPAAGKKTVQQGAATLVFGAASPQLDGVGGVYLKDSDVAVLDDEMAVLDSRTIPSDANSAMLDRQQARRLWQVSEQLLC